MNRVTKISRIKGFGVFRDFIWLEDLPEFQRYNVIYGWNWSGKTLLSRIFEGIQKGQPPYCDEVVVELSSGEKLRSNTFANKPAELKVRVFNRNFVEETIYTAKGSIQPIYVIGEKAKEKQQDLEKVLGLIEEKRRAIETKEQDLRSNNRGLDDLCTDGARAVRDTLLIPGRVYEREQFRNDIETISKEGNYEKYKLDDDKRTQLLQLVQAEPRKNLDIIRFSFSSLKSLFEKARVVCGISVAAEVIKELRQDSDVNVWVEEGLNLHRKLRIETCLFCNQPLPLDRLHQLEAHFSEEYKKVIDEIISLRTKVSKAIENAQGVKIPDTGLFHPDLLKEIAEAQTIFNAVRDDYVKELHSLIKTLDDKRNNPFQNLRSAIVLPDLTDDKIVAVNNVIAEHNTKVENHQEEVNQTRETLKKDIIAQRVEQFTNLKSSIDQLKNELKSLNQEMNNSERKSEDLKRQLEEHRRPADELNCELASYLGHTELQFQIEHTGYRIVRNGEKADSLSEGEKTAISFLYYLKSLQASDFNIQNGIVVIDDPISSLDSNALYYAFGFMKSRVSNVGQLFVLTHNFLFFRQVKDWFRYLGGRRDNDVGYYLLDVRKATVGRISKLVKLDPLLKDYESEYHYLFSLVYKATQAGDNGGGLEQYYYLPNVVRRLLEAFLEFKVPGRESVHRRLQELDFEQAKKERIRRFCDTHSHSRVIDELEQDPVILGEACSVARDVMDLLRSADREHFQRMVQLCGGDE